MPSKPLLALGILSLIALVFLAGACNYRSDCVNFEARLEAQYKQNQNNYDNMWKKFREMAQVPDMYTNDMKKLWDSAIQGRYGEGGSKAVAQFIQEHNPQMDTSLYATLQREIAASRDKFVADQRQLLDIKAQYEMTLNGNSGLFYNALWGFPKKDLSKFDIVTSDETEKVFESKKAGEVKLR